LRYNAVAVLQNCLGIITPPGKQWSSTGSFG
jgi:hypothetical protein